MTTMNEQEMNEMAQKMAEIYTEAQLRGFIESILNSRSALDVLAAQELPAYKIVRWALNLRLVLDEQ